MGVLAVKLRVLVVSITPLLLPMVVADQPELAVAELKFGTSVPAVAVQVSPISGSLEQKSIITSGWLTEVAGVKVTVYVTPVALADELLIVILRVVTCPLAFTAAGRNCPVIEIITATRNITPKERPNVDRKACTLLTCFSFTSLFCKLLILNISRQPWAHKTFMLSFPQNLP